MLFIDFVSEFQVLTSQSGLFHILTEVSDALYSIVAIVLDINFQGFFFSAFCRVGHIALRRFFYSIDISTLSPAYPDFLEVVTSLMVVQGVDGKDLLSLYISDTEEGSYLILSVLELAVVEQDLDVRVIDDSFLDYRGVNHITEFLGHHACNAVELSDRLIQVLDILSHGG